MINPWYDAPDQGTFYCPDCGIVEGFFICNPKIREMVEIIHVDFQRPRPEIIEQLGEENQGLLCWCCRMIPFPLILWT
jgi:hypothetical protein